MKKLISFLFIAILFQFLSAQTIDDLSNLKAKKKVIFKSGSGRLYSVKWKTEDDGFDAATVNEPVSGNTHASHVHNDNCPSVDTNGDEDAFTGNARCEAKLNPDKSAPEEIKMKDIS